MKTSRVRVAISGFGGLDNPEPGTAVARALRLGWRGPLEIEALGYDTWMTGAWSPGNADRLHRIPSPIASGDEEVLRSLLEIHARWRIDALIPCLDLEVFTFARLLYRLRRAGIRTLLPTPETVGAIAKPRLPFFCRSCKVSAPHTIHVQDVADVTLFADQIGYPLMVKGTVAGAVQVANREQAKLAAARLHAYWGGGVLLQKPVEGEEYVVAIVARADGSCMGLVSMRKLGINHRGKGVVGAVVDDPELKRTAHRILAQLQWRGPLELEFIRSRTGELFLIEVNSRFASWILLSHFAGCNLPVLLLREILSPGQRRARPPRAGTVFVRDVEDLAVPVDRLERLNRFGSADGLSANGARRKRVRRDGIRVAVTGISAFDLVLPGLGVARALRAAPEVSRVYGLGYSPYDTGAHRTNLFDAVFSLTETQDPDTWLERLRTVQEKVGLDVVLPCLDTELSALVEVAPELERMGICALLPSPTALARRAKGRIHHGGDPVHWGGFEIPETFRVRSIEQLKRCALALGFPLVIKGPVGGSETAYSLDQARLVLREKDGKEVLVQRFVRGEEFGVAALCGQDHRLVRAVAVKKLLSCERGKAWGAICVELPDLVKSLDHYLRALCWRGPLEAEFIRDATRERFILIEVNPRFPAWVGFSADLGVNLPRDAVLTALGRPPAPESPTHNLLYMRNCQEIPVDARSFARFATEGVLQHA